jgi:hypothetical protein
MCGENGEKIVFALLSPLMKARTILPMNRILPRENLVAGVNVAIGSKGSL